MLGFAYQKKCDNPYIKDSGCYFLSLLQAIDRREEEVNKCYDLAVDRKYITYDCFVNQPTRLLYDLTGKNYILIVSKSFDNIADIIIAKWYNQRTNYSHFVLMDKDNKVLWDPLGESVTVKEGYIKDYRLFYKK